MRFSNLAVGALLAYTAMAEAEVDSKPADDNKKIEHPPFEVSFTS